MNRTAVKNFAQWGRRHLHDLVRARLASFGITEKGIETPQRIQGGLIVGGQTLTLSTTDIGQYDALLHHYQELGGTAKEKYALLVDEVGYTWFNRLAALRFMEVHGYISRSLSSETPGSADPDLLRDALALATGGDLPNVTPDQLSDWQRLYQPGEVYRRLLVAQAATLEVPLPFLFGRDKPWLDLFLPDNLLNKDSIVRRMVNDIPEDDWQDIEIVGWLYQFYISERKAEVFEQKGKYTPRDIPAATQLFTPHWIVRYMVENSLGRVWLEAHPESTLREQMPYYLESENPAPASNPDLTPEDLSVMDPACGSGHILVYAFDLLAHIYRERGYAEREIPALILEHNLHGLDIDERAAQLASFAVLMKARDLNNRLFRREIPALNIVQVKPTRGLRLPNASSKDMLGNYAVLSGGLTDADTFNPNDWQPLVSAFEDADHLGSLITPPTFNAGRLRAQLHWLETCGGLDIGALGELRHLLQQAELLTKKYDAVVANPPYMGSGELNPVLKEFIGRNYICNSDIGTSFIERLLGISKASGVTSAINQQAWMFGSTYFKYRQHIIVNTDILSLIHLGARAFPEIAGEVVQSAAYIIRPTSEKDPIGTYVRLVGFNTDDKSKEFFNKDNYFSVRQKSFERIEGSLLGYWLSDSYFKAFDRTQNLSKISQPRQGLATANNDRFLRLWQEPNLQLSSINQSRSAKIWIPFNKGGAFRKWYGNRDYLIKWQNSGQEIKSFKPKSVIRNESYYFRESMTWTDISSYPAFRYSPEGTIFDGSGPSAFSDSKSKLLISISFCNSIVAAKLFDLFAPSYHFREGPVGVMPVILGNHSSEVANSCVQLSRTDWDNFEASWDFQIHPLLRSGAATLTDAYATWQAQAEAAFRELQRLEEENNRYWIDAYGLQDELTPEVPDNQITIRRADLGRDARSLLSYAVGCMMGRYSLDEPGLIHAGQSFDAARHTRFPADADGILPVTQDAYFDDDVTTHFAEFLRVALGPQQVAKNMEWVATALSGQKAGESAEARIRRYFTTEFVSDHIQTYKKRPIYWLFTSGKKRGFGALVYLHRYDEGTLARLRTDYLLPLQRKLDAELERACGDLDAASSTPLKKAAEKRIKELGEQIVELRAYDEKLRHLADQRISLDLDDGVAYNYWRVRGLVYEGIDLKMADLEKKSQWKRDLLAQQSGQVHEAQPSS